ncbi:MAG: hypothetical protein RIQ81_1637 [Pseudomonadota bacterium]|jgi:3-deoxy-manno-octulosonate cytidylyltransferase (CMP-KDO synthetase)
MRNWLVVVPARLASTRLPDKPLADLNGKPLLARVVDNLAPLSAAGAAIVAAIDDPKTASACQRNGITFQMTRADHATGTDRCAEVATQPGFADRTFILNVQGDEPFIDPQDLMALCARIEVQARSRETFPATLMGSMYFRCRDQARFASPATVKVVCDAQGNAVYFSRSQIPWDRDNAGLPAEDFLVHMGVYAFHRDALQAFCRLPHGKLEAVEKLEQLRAVEAGWRIVMCEARKESIGIDTPEDLAAARRKMGGHG